MFFSKKALILTRRLLLIKVIAIILISLFFVFWPDIKQNMASLITMPAGPVAVPSALAVDATPDYVTINRFIEHAPTLLPKNLIKAIAWCESEWKHYDDQGEPLMGVNLVQGPWGRDYTYDWGLMQINDGTVCLDPRVWDQGRIKTDPQYNILAGIAVLEQKMDYIEFLKHRPNWPDVVRRYHLYGRDDMDILIKAYNGFQPSWAYVDRVRTLMGERPWEKLMAAQLNHTYPGTRVTIQAISSGAGRLLQTASSYASDQVVLRVMPHHRFPFYALITPQPKQRQ